MIMVVAFYILAIGTVVLALMVIIAKNPFYSAMSLLGCMLMTAGIFAMNSAGMAVVFQIGIYIPWIMVLLLIVLNLIKRSPPNLGGAKIGGTKILGAYLLGFIAVLLFVRLIPHLPASTPGAIDQFGTLEKASAVLLTEYLLPLLLLPILLLISIMGATFYIQKSRKEE